MKTQTVTRSESDQTVEKKITLPTETIDASNADEILKKNGLL